MNVRETQVTPCSWRVDVELLKAQVEPLVVDRLRRIAGREELPGFRRGKAPLAVVRRVYGDEAKAQVEGELVERAVADALSRLGPPVLPPSPIRMEEDGDAVRFAVTVHTFPELPPLDVHGLELHWPVPELALTPAVDDPVRAAELRAAVAGVLEEELADELRALRAQRVEEALLARFQDVEVPVELLVALAAGAPGAGEEAAAGRDALLVDMLFFALAAQNGLRADPAAVAERVRQLVADAVDPQAAMDALYAHPMELHEVEEEVLRDAVVRWVHDRARVVEEPLPVGGVEARGGAPP